MTNWLRSFGWAVLLATPCAAAWPGYGGNPQHTGISPVAAQPYDRIRWSTPVDDKLANANGPLFIHFGSPLVTSDNSVVIPVRNADSSTYRVDVRNGADGSLKYSLSTDYRAAPHDWVPSYSPVMSERGRLYYAGAGGTVLYRDSPDAATGATGRLVFYGETAYRDHKSAFDDSVFITTPIVAGPWGEIYFGFVVVGPNPLNLKSGIARISVAGVGRTVAATAVVSDTAITQVQMGSAPALSNDSTVLYFAVNSGNYTGGYLVAVESRTLRPLSRVRLIDPATGAAAIVQDDSSAAPTVAPDGDIYFGVLENPVASNDGRGWLLHFDATLKTGKTPGAFGWDTTASIVPVSMVPSYKGTSPYLLFTKYNNYVGYGPGGDGMNRIAIIDPASTMREPVTGATVMAEVMTLLSPTVRRNARTEWCVNSGAVDPQTGSIITNNEDGVLYRWVPATNSLTQIRLTGGVGEAYTPTAIGPDGTVFAINDAILFAVGR